MRVRRTSATAATVVSFSLIGSLLGCVSTPLQKDGELARLWSSKLREYNLYAVFPPREDIQVGDIYLLCQSGGDAQSREMRSAVASQGFEPVPLFVASLQSVREKLLDHYQTRVLAPSTTPGSGAKDGKAVQTDTSPALPSSDNTYVRSATDGRTKRFRNVSFPEFFSITASGVSADALVPTTWALLGAGVSRSDVESITVSVPASESYSLPAARLLEALGSLTADEIRLIATLTRQSPACAEADLIVVSEVYLARAIDIRMNFRSDAAAKVSAALAIAQESKRSAVWSALSKHFAGSQNPPPAGTSSSTPQGTTKALEGTLPAPGGAQSGRTGTTTQPGGDKKEAPADRQPLPKSGSAGESTQAKDVEFVNELRRLVDEVEGRIDRDFPGVGVTYFAGALGGITLSRTFTNPVVIGYRGLAVTVRQADGQSWAIGVAPVSPGGQKTLAKEPKVQTQ